MLADSPAGGLAPTSVDLRQAISAENPAHELQNGFSLKEGEKKKEKSPDQKASWKLNCRLVVFLN